MSAAPGACSWSWGLHHGQEMRSHRVSSTAAHKYSGTLSGQKCVQPQPWGSAGSSTPPRAAVALLISARRARLLPARECMSGWEGRISQRVISVCRRRGKSWGCAEERSRLQITSNGEQTNGCLAWQFAKPRGRPLKITAFIGRDSFRRVDGKRWEQEMERGERGAAGLGAAPAGTALPPVCRLTLFCITDKVRWLQPVPPGLVGLCGVLSLQLLRSSTEEQHCCHQGLWHRWAWWLCLGNGF